MNDREFLGPDEAMDAEETEEMAEEKPHFSYEGETGPEYWGSLSELDCL